MVSQRTLFWSLGLVMMFGAVAASFLVIKHVFHPTIMPPQCPPDQTCFATPDGCLYAYPAGFDEPGTRHKLEVKYLSWAQQNSRQRREVAAGRIHPGYIIVHYDGTELKPTGCPPDDFTRPIIPLTDLTSQ